ncbi:MAG: hypothetical protein ACI9G1_005403, partial [Pirellulaceae bacterium]
MDSREHGKRREEKGQVTGAKSELFAVFILSRFCSVVRAAKPAAALSIGRKPAD